MRNLKKILALVLAMVMTFSVMATANAFTDDKDIDADYAEAVEVLAGLGVLKGYEVADDEYAIKPQNSITRAEVAAMIYRIATGDVEDEQVALYAGAAKFADAIPTWAAGYIGYCANAGYIKGYEDGTFRPQGNVTGFEALVMILRAVGFDKMNEFTGAEWSTNAAKIAKELGITDNVKPGVLVNAASREVVAEILFNAILTSKVTYSPAFGYQNLGITAGTIGGSAAIVKNSSIGKDVFGLAISENLRDSWGRPYYVWYKETGKVAGYQTTETVYATIEYAPLATYTTEVSECDIAAELGLKKDGTVARETLNGDTVNAFTGRAVNFANGAIEVKYSNNKMIGAQGRLTEIYKVDGNYEIVMLDEYLAVVNDVTEVETDKNGHITKNAQLYLTIFAEQHAIDVVLTDTKNYKYEAADMLLVYFDNAGVNATSLTSSVDDWKVKVIGYADSMVGAQSAFTTDPVHIINDVEYPDAVQFNHDETERLKTVNYTWYFDSYNNLIGAFKIDTIYTYGVVSAIKWVEMDENMEDGYALATITYIDGTSENAKVASIAGTKLTSANVEETKQDNVDTWVRKALYEIETTSKGLVLTETTEVENAVIETGVPAMTASVDAGNATMYLVWNGVTKAYETYTGIKNIPTYEGTNTIWVKDAKGDAVVEYVFINNPTDANTYKTVTYFWNDTLTVKTNLKNNAVVSYTVTGGYVNGELAPITIDDADYERLMEIKALKGNLMVLNLVNDYVEVVEEVTTMPTYVKSIKANAVYAGKASDASFDAAQNVLVTEAASYDMEGAAEITYKYGLSQTVKYDNNAYLYVIYTEGTSNEKIASLVYITNAEGAEYVAPVAPVAPLTAAMVKAGEILKGENAADMRAMIAELVSLIADPAGLDAADYQKALDLIAALDAKADAIEAAAVAAKDLEAAKAEAIKAYNEWLVKAGETEGWTDAMIKAGQDAYADAVNAMTTVEAVEAAAPGFVDNTGSIWNDVVKPAIVKAADDATTAGYKALADGKAEDYLTAIEAALAEAPIVWGASKNVQGWVETAIAGRVTPAGNVDEYTCTVVAPAEVSFEGDHGSQVVTVTVTVTNSYAGVVSDAQTADIDVTFTW